MLYNHTGLLGENLHLNNRIQRETKNIMSEYKVWLEDSPVAMRDATVTEVNKKYCTYHTYTQPRDHELYHMY